MGLIGLLFALILLMVFCLGRFVAFVYWYEPITRFLSGKPDVKKLFPYSEKVWKTSPSAFFSEEIVPFRLQVSDEALDDLRSRLQRTRFGPPIDGVNFTYGFPPDQLKKVVHYWLEKYDWRKQEDYINSHNQFQTNIEGLNVHFVRAIPTAPNAQIVPILLLHGWPGSFFELLKLVPLLTKPKEISPGKFAAFEVIVPSLPGYGYSEAAQQPGMDASNMARILNTLMVRLGHTEYFIHGGDWGSIICRNLAGMYPERIMGMEITMAPVPMGAHALKSLVAKFLPSLMDVGESEKRKLLFPNITTMLREMGYMLLQSTKPNTVGAALSDSPAGLAAYIIEKFSSWTNMENLDTPDGNLQKYFSLDDLLTNVMIYWTSNSIMTSQRLYREFFPKGGMETTRSLVVSVPTVLSDFRYEIPGANAPAAFLKPYFTDLINISKHSSGGHFPAMECPTDLAADIWTLATSVLQRG